MDERNEVGTGAMVPMGMSLVRKPAEILREAKEAAMALADMIKQKQKPVIFNGEQYLEFEDWQTCARFYGLTAKIVWTRPLEIGGAIGFEACAEVINNVTGQIISAAEAMCLNDEDKWSKRAKYEYRDGKRVKVGEVSVPLFQLRSMAQTRAGAKALRNVLAWIVVLAGFKPNVAEELTGDEFEPKNPKADIKPPQRKSENGSAAPSAPPPAATPANGPEDPDEVFFELEDLLTGYCSTQNKNPNDVLKEITKYSKDGKDHWLDDITKFSHNDKGRSWAGSALRKLRERIDREQSVK